MGTTGRVNSNTWWQRNSHYVTNITNWWCIMRVSEGAALWCSTLGMNSLQYWMNLLGYNHNNLIFETQAGWFTAVDVNMIMCFLRSRRKGMRCWWKARPCLSHRVSPKLRHAAPLVLSSLSLWLSSYLSSLVSPVVDPHSLSSLLFFPW